MAVMADVATKEVTRTKLSEPKKWKVIMLNDDQTPMNFVTQLLVEIFRHSEERANELMMQIHLDGSTIVGVYAFEIAEAKSVEATGLARASGFPLQLKLEATS